MDIKGRIIEGASQLFKMYGTRSVTMDSLANHIGISKRTIYENFQDKDEIFEDVLRLMTEKQKMLIKRILDDSENAIEAVFRVIEMNKDHYMSMSPAFHEDMKKYHNEVLMNKSEKCEMPDYRNNIEIIERGIKQKLFRKDINPDIVNRCLYSLALSVMDDRLYPFEDFTRQEVLKNGMINYLRGISTHEGIQLIDKRAAKI
jgi:TetR/AcrR family transcriptional regulator, cholesterol catabolism regulator